MKFNRRIAAAGVAAAAVISLSAAPASASTWGHSDQWPGVTTVLLNPDVVPVLVGLGVSPVAPGTLTAPGGVVQVAFPIIGVVHDGRIAHRGGLDFNKVNGSHDVKITNFVVDTEKNVLTARAEVDGVKVGRIAVFALEAPQPINGMVPACAGVPAGLTLTSGAAAALGIPWAAGVFMGDACVVPGSDD